MPMYSLTCGCGKKVEGEDADNVEAQALHHYLNDHKESFEKSTVEQLTAAMKNTHEMLGLHGHH